MADRPPPDVPDESFPSSLLCLASVHCCPSSLFRCGTEMHFLWLFAVGHHDICQGSNLWKCGCDKEVVHPMTSQWRVENKRFSLLPWWTTDICLWNCCVIVDWRLCHCWGRRGIWGRRWGQRSRYRGLVMQMMFKVASEGCSWWRERTKRPLGLLQYIARVITTNISQWPGWRLSQVQRLT